MASGLELWHLAGMPKRIKHSRRPNDVNQIAHRLVEQSTAQQEVLPPPPTVTASVSEYMAAIGRKGGKIGGKRRLSTLTADERKIIAGAAAKARWNKERKPKEKHD
jgi:hypothetical protein